MNRNKSESVWWRLPNPRPRKPIKALLIASISVFTVWFVFLVITALRVGGG